MFRKQQPTTRRGRLLSTLIAAVAILGGSFVQFAEPADAQQASFVYVDAGLQQTCAIKATTAVVYCWGANNYGQSTPPWGWTFKQIATGDEMTCGLGGDGVVTCWGAPHYGLYSPSRQQWRVPGTFKHIDIAPDGFTGCGIQVSGSLKCWDGAYGGTATANDVGTNTPSGTFISVAANDTFSCGVRSDNTAVCWGAGDRGQPLPNTAGTFLQVSMAGASTCFLRTNRDITCQGDNRWGQAPALVAGPFSSVSVGGAHACGLKTTGAIVCWGVQPYKPGTAQQVLPPNFGQTVVPAGTWKQVSAGELHTCGIRSDNMLVCWGDNTYGRLA